MIRILPAATIFLASTALADRVAISVESPLEAVPVLELYTSHGCSSCPPADRWLRNFTDHPDLWHQVIPMAFHVDYWDWIGWRDRFASTRYTARQKNYRRVGGLRTVYTPGFVLRGGEWKGWFGGMEPTLGTGETVGRLGLQIAAGEAVVARFAPDSSLSGERFQAHLVVLGFGLQSKIGAGENAGRSLEEDFVVLGMRSGESPATGADLEWTLRWPDLVTAESERRAVAVWISRDGHPAPVQAAGAWLP